MFPDSCPGISITSKSRFTQMPRSYLLSRPAPRKLDGPRFSFLTDWAAAGMPTAMLPDP